MATPPRSQSPEYESSASILRIFQETSSQPLGEIHLFVVVADRGERNGFGYLTNPS